MSRAHFVFPMQFQDPKQRVDGLGVALYVSMSRLHEQLAIDIRVTRAVDGDNAIRIASRDHSMSGADDGMEPNVLRDTKLSHGLQARLPEGEDGVGRPLGPTRGRSKMPLAR